MASHFAGAPHQKAMSLLTWALGYAHGLRRIRRICCNYVNAAPRSFGLPRDAITRALMPSAFARNTFLGFISGAVVLLAGFIGGAIAARLLGPDGMGVIAYAAWCVTFATTVASLGLGLVLQRFIPNLRVQGKHDDAGGLIGAAARLAIIAAIVGSLLLFCWLYWPGSNAMTASSPASRRVLIVIVVGWFICWRIGDVYLFYLRGEQRFGELARLSAVSALIKLLVMGFGAWLFGIAGALAGYVVAYVIPAARIRQLLRERPFVSQELRREVMSFAVTSWLVAVIGGLVFGRTEIVFLEHYSGIGAVGLFAAAAALTETVVQLPPLLLAALLPYFSEQHGLGMHDHMHRLYRTMTGLITLIVAPLCIGMAAVAPVLVPVLFGAEFVDAVPVASVLLLTAAAVNSLGVTTVYLIYSTGKIGLLPISNGLGLLGTIVLGFVLVPPFGLMGAAWVRAAVQVLVVAIEIWYVTRKLGFAPPYRAFGTIIVSALIPSAVAYALIIWVGGILSLVLAIPAAVIVFAIALRVLGVLPLVDPQLINTLIAHAPRRIGRVLCWVLKLVAPATKGSPEPD
jgi:O-antigen/teichoic acid export membrane protein